MTAFKDERAMEPGVTQFHATRRLVSPDVFLSMMIELNEPDTGFGSVWIRDGGGLAIRFTLQEWVDLCWAVDGMRDQLRAARDQGGDE